MLKLKILNCPFCSSLNNHVVDKRTVGGTGEIRRRRECLKCQKRFTTYEKIADLGLVVIKRDGRHEPFYKAKLINGISKALEKRPLENQAEEIANQIEKKLLKRGQSLIGSKLIGKMVLAELKKVDAVAYVRFASVYRQFKQPEDFTKEITSLNN